MGLGCPPIFGGRRNGWEYPPSQVGARRIQGRVRVSSKPGRGGYRDASGGPSGQERDGSDYRGVLGCPEPGRVQGWIRASPKPGRGGDRVGVPSKPTTLCVLTAPSKWGLVLERLIVLGWTFSDTLTRGQVFVGRLLELHILKLVALYTVWVALQEVWHRGWGSWRVSHGADAVAAPRYR